MVDGHSEDKTVQKASTFTKKLPKLTILTSKKHNVSTQRNLGAKKASGQYLIFNDADNRLPNYFLEGIKYNLSKEPVDIFTCWCTADSDSSADKTIAIMINVLLEAALLLDYPGALGALIGCRTKKFLKIGGFNSKINFAEDGEIIRRAKNKGCLFTIYKNPRFTFSFRRFRKKGRLKSLQQYAKLHLKIIIQEDISRQDYPMGGQIFNDNPVLQTFIDKIQSILRTTKKKAKIKEKLKSLITLFENNGS